MKTDIREKGYLVFPFDKQLCIWEFDMEKYDSTPFFRLGVALGALTRSLRGGDALDHFSILNAKIYLDLFAKNNKKEKALRLSVKTAESLIALINDYVEKIKSNTLAVNNLSALPGIDDKDVLLQCILDLQNYLSEEIPTLNIFFVTKHRAYDMTILIYEGESLLSPNTLNFIEASKSEVVNDMREAARSLAFGIHTSVGFHLFRAIEAIAVDEYLPLLGISVEEYRDEKNCPNLGSCIGILEGQNGKFKVTEPVDVKITSILRHIVKKYRNPIMHPDAIWGHDEANGAIGLVVSIIDMMVQDIIEIKKKASSLSS